jgi:hypothetical protein
MTVYKRVQASPVLIKAGCVLFHEHSLAVYCEVTASNCPRLHSGLSMTSVLVNHIAQRIIEYKTEHKSHYVIYHAC